MIPRSLPYLNFFLATSSLTFQLTVLYPWHITLDEGFAKLKAESSQRMEESFRVHERRLERIEEHLERVVGSATAAERGN
ncbi:hypothetical protein BCR35DRAFT_336352 [Leucosporidium creatinivorum]|uniref:Uncharacterized protein n=1 Tax=Leucosporidium creatinivorum TaxID=106004 RepID=A0A1Y2C979_9BASI|nr:hypothetical protein BCR35DRAFT_336352 [Leucosporidium creatinivorum]